MRAWTTIVFLTTWAAGNEICAQVINEINVHPAGGVERNSMFVAPPCSPEMTAAEWIEIYNPSPCNALDISCYILGSNMGAPENVRLCSDFNGEAVNGDNEGFFVFPPGTVVPPMGFVTVGGGAALDFYPYDYRGTYYCGGPRWYLNSRTGWLGLFDPQGAVVDAVFWGEFGENEIFSAVQLGSRGRVECACPGGPNFLPSARELYPQNIRFIGLTVPTPDFYSDLDLGKFYREPDGGCWRIVHRGTPGACNTRCWDGAFANIASKGGYFCESTTVVAGDVHPCSSNEATYTWSVDGLAVQSGPNFSFDGVEGDVVSLVLTVTLADGCTDSDTATLYRYKSKPEIQPKNLVVCPGDTAFFTVTGLVEEGATWEWSASGVNVWRAGVSTLGVAGADSGNYRLDLRFRFADGCVSDGETARIWVQAAPPAAILNYFPETCAGEKIMLRAETVAGARIQWDFDGGTATDSLGYGGIAVFWNSPGEKRVRIAVSHPDFPCVSQRTETQVVVRPVPETPSARLVPSSESGCGYVVVAVAPAPDGIKHVVDFGGAGILTDSSQTDEIRYLVLAGAAPPPYRITFFAENGYACVSDTVELTADFDPEISEKILRYVPPNVFTPNGDPVNPVYFLPGLQSACAEYTMEIFDRWGMRVATIDEKNQTWNGEVNGRPAPESVFVYVLKIKLYDGRSAQKTGTITLLR